MTPRLPKAIERILTEPTWPGTLPRTLERKNLGVDYDTAWTRSPGAKAVRKVYQTYVSAPLTRLVARPTIYGEEHLAPLAGPAIFTVTENNVHSVKDFCIVQKVSQGLLAQNGGTGCGKPRALYQGTTLVGP